jgi:hypothetical protein
MGWLRSVIKDSAGQEDAAAHIDWSFIGGFTIEIRIEHLCSPDTSLRRFSSAALRLIDFFLLHPGLAPWAAFLRHNAAKS